ncbi:hypothetical protein [Lysobacter sp. P5_B9]
MKKPRLYEGEMVHQPFVIGTASMWLFVFFMFWIVGLMGGSESDDDATAIYTGLWAMLLILTLVGWVQVVEYRTPIYRTQGLSRIGFGLLVLAYWLITVTSMHALALMHMQSWARPSSGMEERQKRFNELALIARTHQDAIYRAVALEAYFANHQDQRLSVPASKTSFGEEVTTTQDGRVKLYTLEKAAKPASIMKREIQLDGSGKLRLRSWLKRNERNVDTTLQVRLLIKEAKASSRAILADALEKLSRPVDTAGWLGVRSDWLRLLSESPAWTYSVSFEGSLLYRVVNAMAALVTGTLAFWTGAPLWRRFKRWLESGPVR